MCGCKKNDVEYDLFCKNCRRNTYHPSKISQLASKPSSQVQQYEAKDLGTKTDANSKNQTVPKPLPANKETYLAKLYADKRAPIHLSVGRVCTGCKHKWSTNDIGA